MVLLLRKRRYPSRVLPRRRYHAVLLAPALLIKVAHPDCGLDSLSLHSVTEVCPTPSFHFGNFVNQGNISLPLGGSNITTKDTMPTFADFLARKKPKAAPKFTFASLFSGAGIGDFGLVLAGGKCLAACEIDPQRAAVHKANIGAPVWGNLRTEKAQIIKHLHDAELDVLVATPPCQSFSSANSRRGLREDPEHASRDERNNLFFEAIEVARKIKPKIVLFENVPNFLKRKIQSSDKKIIGRVEEFLAAGLGQYRSYANVICFSELDLPQRRRRSIAVFVRNDLGDEIAQTIMHPNQWPGKLKGLPATIIEAIGHLPQLDSGAAATISSQDDTLHQVPLHEPLHYRWISDIPSGSGRSSWENACPGCDDDSTPVFEVICQTCGESMINRPHVRQSNGDIRPIKGFKTSYKRMPADQIAPTMTTASGHFSSDLKLHPTQNRVLSPRECAILQAIPTSFKWPREQQFRKAYLVREMIGEAVPPLVTYRFGRAVAAALGA